MLERRDDLFRPERVLSLGDWIYRSEVTYVVYDAS
jgi:hypothetical protein